MTQQQASKCPYGCARGRPVCREGKRLYKQVKQVRYRFPRRMSLNLFERRQPLFDQWAAVSDAYLAHIGQGPYDWLR